MAVPNDTIGLINELNKQGHGRKRIAYLSGEREGVVRRVLDGEVVETCDKLSAREIAYLLQGWAVGR